MMALLAAAIAFTACDKGETNGPEAQYNSYTVGFEDAELPAEGYIVKADYSYSEQGVTFPQKFTDWGGGSTSWSGFAVSNKTDKETAGYLNQYSVYGDGGFGGSKQFAVAYYSSYDGDLEFSFGEGEEHEFEYLYVTNSTYAALAVKNGEGNAKAFADGDWFKMTITGYDTATKAGNSVDVYLADYRDGKSFIMTDWTKVDLSSLGTVNKLGFTFSSTDNDPESGMNTPAYCCFDNITYKSVRK